MTTDENNKTLYGELPRGQVDLIVTDPPYNTGEDFRYNDKWDKDPNDPDLGELQAGSLSCCK